MKLSFSTLSCPDWSFRDIYATAADLGYNGIEIRGIADEIYAPKIYAFSDEKLESTRGHLSRRSLEIPILTSGAYILDNPDLASARREIGDYALLASKLGVKYIRVLIEKTPRPEITNPDLSAAASEYSFMCDIAAKYGVTLLTETNGALADSAVCRSFMESIDRPNSGVIWDAHHPYRFFGESPEHTVGNIGKYIRHVHLKDSVVADNGRISYQLTGYGTIPFRDIISALRDSGFDGYLSYEWVKRWSRELAEPGIALYQYINYMRSAINDGR